MSEDTDVGGVATGADGLPADAALRHPADDDLDERLAAALERMGHLTRTMVARQTYAEGVSALQMQLLTRLRTPAAGPRVSDLAVELDVSQATVSDALSTLRRKDLVSKERDPADRRSTVFALTAAGEELADRLASWDRPLTDRMVDLPETDKGTALRLVLDLVARLHADGVINVARTCLTCRSFNDAPEVGGPYRCTLLDVDFDDRHLRVDCAEHEPAGPAGPELAERLRRGPR